MSNDITILRATPADAEQISKVLLDAFIQFKHFYTQQAFDATVISAEEVSMRMKEGNVWVAVKDNMVVGSAAVVKRNEDLYIRGMAVLLEARGLQIGWKLLEQIQ